jgi:spore coat polysaccharide biosynthesis protein SpsF
MLRPATADDAQRLLDWRNDPVTRGFSLTGAGVEPGEHAAWLERRLVDPGSRLWIAEVDGVPVGQVRAERLEAGVAEIHLAVAPQARGHGYGAAMVRAAVAAARAQLHAERFAARVLAANAASRRTFERAGFTPADPAADPLLYERRPLGRVVGIVQARAGSTRLPRKVLADLGGAPVLARMLERLAGARRLDAVTVATTDSERDDPVAELARAAGAGVFRGPELDVLGRFDGAAEAAGADVVVRLTADCPLMDPAVVDQVVDAFDAQRPDLATNAPPEGRTFPDGLDVEVLSRATLATAAREARDPADREHVTRRLHDGRHRVLVVHHDPPAGEVRITVDTEQDLERVRRVWAALGDRAATAGMQDVLDALEASGA